MSNAHQTAYERKIVILIYRVWLQLAQIEWVTSRQLSLNAKHAVNNHVSCNPQNEINRFFSSETGIQRLALTHHSHSIIFGLEFVCPNVNKMNGVTSSLDEFSFRWCVSVRLLDARRLRVATTFFCDRFHV